MKTAMRQLQLTALAYHPVLKLSRTIADLAGSEAIIHAHLVEAFQYRSKQRICHNQNIDVLGDVHDQGV